jgi:hypothetical protein
MVWEGLLPISNELLMEKYSFNKIYKVIPCSFHEKKNLLFWSQFSFKKPFLSAENQNIFKILKIKDQSNSHLGKFIRQTLMDLWKKKSYLHKKKFSLKRSIWIQRHLKKDIRKNIIDSVFVKCLLNTLINEHHMKKT